jgi:flagellar hook-basal body complex protein FliE
MSLKLASIAPIAPPEIPTDSAFGTESTGGISFKDALGSAIQGVESAHNNANQAVQSFLAGEGGDLHSTILASQRADLEFQMFLQVRNKVVSAYQEVMRMQM